MQNTFLIIHIFLHFLLFISLLNNWQIINEHHTQTNTSIGQCSNITTNTLEKSIHIDPNIITHIIFNCIPIFIILYPLFVIIQSYNLSAKNSKTARFFTCISVTALTIITSILVAFDNCILTDALMTVWTLKHHTESVKIISPLAVTLSIQSFIFLVGGVSELIMVYKYIMRKNMTHEVLGFIA